MPNSVKAAIDGWTMPAGIADGLLFRSVVDGDRVSGYRLGDKVDWQMK